jgi:AcrR family transcriptional regulator
MAGKKSIDTEEKIIQATLDIIEKNTISGTRMRLIADQAEVYQSNLHYYYKSKKELMIAVQKNVAERCVELRESYLEQTEDTLEGNLDVFLKQKLTFIIDEPKYDYAEIDFWIQSRLDDDFKTEFKRSFVGWRSELQAFLSRYAPHMDAQRRKILSSMIISLLEGASIQYLVDSDAFDVDEYFGYIKQLILKEIEY